MLQREAHGDVEIACLRRNGVEQGKQQGFVGQHHCRFVEDSRVSRFRQISEDASGQVGLGGESRHACYGDISCGCFKIVGDIMKSAQDLVFFVLSEKQAGLLMRIFQVISICIPQDFSFFSFDKIPDHRALRRR